jgi:hypothetical protein
MIGVGVAHFVDCLAGREQPLLRADRALHVLEIAQRAAESAEHGVALPLETAFPWPPSETRAAPAAPRSGGPPPPTEACAQAQSSTARGGGA